MPTAFTPPPADCDAPWPEKYEIIHGERIKKAPKSHARVMGIMLLIEWLRKTFPAFCVGQHMPINLPPDSEPDADAVVLTKSYAEFTAIPTAGEVHLVADVSDTTLAFDLKQKAALYARAGISEYWVLDVVDRRLVVHRQPHGSIYRDVRVYTEQQFISALAAPESVVEVATFFNTP